MKYELLMAGVGGQGIITLSELVATSALKKGIKVTATQDKGLAQRWGSVKAHVRLGDVYSPMIPKYAANAILSLEIAETLRYLDYINENTILVVDTKRMIPKDNMLEKEDTLSPLKVKKILSPYPHVFFVNAESGSKEAEFGTNIFMLGVLLGLDGRLKDFVTVDEMKETVKSMLRSHVSENLEVLERGASLGSELRDADGV